MPSFKVEQSQEQSMGQWVKEVGESEGRAVMAGIGIPDLSHAKAGRLPTGVSSRERWTNNLDVGKQMTADFDLSWCAHK